MTKEAFRAPTLRERELIQYFIRADFQGAAEVRAQLESCDVCGIDEQGSLGLRVKSASKANVRHRVPVELLAKDADGFGVHVLLHVVDGVCKEIEVYKDTSTAISTWPSSWDVIVSGPEQNK